MNKLLKSISLVIFAIALLVFAIRFTNKDSNSDIAYQKAFSNNYKIFSIQLPEKLSFCDEEVPMDLYYVREAIDRELLTNTYWQSNLILFIKRSYRYFPIIEPILKKEGIPDDFKYLALIESSLINAISPVGATGFWQFMKPTALMYGLEINKEIDERYNIEKSTEAACKYLKASYNIHKSWTNAAAAYNMGDAGVKSQMIKQKQTNYWQLLLNSETERYVPRILAAKIILEAPVKYGVYIRIKDLYQPIPTRNITIDSSIKNLADFAIEQKITYKILKDFNPWLRDNSLTNPFKKSYKIKLPIEGYTSYLRQLSDVFDDYKIYNDTLKIE